MGSKNTRLAAFASNIDATGNLTISVGGTTVYNSISNFPVSGNNAGDLAFTDSDDSLYIFTGQGWFKIGIINVAPTITSGPDASYFLNKDGTATVITLVAADPEGIPITWSYAVTAGSLTNGGGTTATVSQNNNIFTITPSTNSAYAGAFSITFTASDGVNIATAASSFTLSFSTFAYDSTKNTSTTNAVTSTPTTLWFDIADEYNVTIYDNIVADIFLWGGGGGAGAAWAGSASNGGAGGYVYAQGIQIPAGTYKFVVGAGGIGGVYSSGETQAVMDANNEDFGNGGLGTQGNYSAAGFNNGGVGGGFTGIFATAVSQANSILIAGGGGGGSGSSNFHGGQGGGTTGSVGGGNYPGQGGTQSAGGAGGATGATSGNAGSALQGGDGIVGSGFGGGGGGGGYFGGGSAGLNASSGVGGGGGGSGYISVSYTKTTSGFETATVKQTPATTATGAPNNPDAGKGGTGNSTRPTANGKDGAIKIIVTSVV